MYAIILPGFMANAQISLAQAPSLPGAKGDDTKGETGGSASIGSSLDLLIKLAV